MLRVRCLPLFSFSIVASLIGCAVVEAPPPAQPVGVAPETFQCHGQTLTAAQLADMRGITLEQLALVKAKRGLTTAELCDIPQGKLDRAVWRSANPKPDHPGEALAYRKLQQQDEKGNIPADGLVVAAAQRNALAASSFSLSAAGIGRGSWVWLGPGNIGGRVRTILVHPTNSNILWAASVAGGIWKSLDGGASWQILDDFLANMAVSTLVLDPTNPDVLYAGTGEGFYNGDGLQGAGVFKSTNGGTTWTQLAATNTGDWYYVNRLAVSNNGAVLLAATNSGIWRSTDGGATWSPRSASRTLDINFDPIDASKAIASSSHSTAWYSIDAGLTWTAATGLPGGGLVERVEVAYAPSSPNIVYASVGINSGEIYKSTNGGQSYVQVSTGYSYLGSQAWYDNIIWVNPTDANKLIVGGIDLWRSTDGGATLSKISEWWNAPSSAHADHHAIVEDPGFNGTTNRKVYFGNDGGVYRADNVDAVVGTSGWTELNNGLGITQFYGAAGNADTGEIIGGTQDNGTLFFAPAGGTEGWKTTFGGDGGWSGADPTDLNYFYGEYVYLNLHRSSNRGVSAEYISGQRWNGSAWVWKNAPYRIDDARDGTANFIAPFILDPNNSNRILAGGASLWRSDDARTPNTATTGPQWAVIKGAIGANISAIAVAKGNSDVIWVAYNNGHVFKTSNGTAVTPTWTRVDNKTPALPNRYVTRITIDNADSNKVYVSFGGFTSDNIWRTLDGGINWSDVTGSGATGLPNIPVRSLVIHPDNANWLYAGTELGIYTSENGGASWLVPHDGPTNTSVDELFWMDRTLVAATHGRGVFKVAPYIAPPSAQTATFVSEAANDGFVLESGETTNLGGTANAGGAIFYLGDDAADKQYRAILHFGTGTLPDNAIVTKATLRIRKLSVVGTNPFGTHGALGVAVRKGAFSNRVTLQASDFQAVADQPNGGTFGTTAVSNWYELTLDAAALPFVNVAGSTQMRLAFALDDNDDNGADAMKFASGNHATVGYRPQLIVEYATP